MKKILSSLKTYLILSVILIICGLAIYFVFKKGPKIPERALFVKDSGINIIFYTQGIFSGMLWR